MVLSPIYLQLGKRRGMPGEGSALGERSPDKGSLSELMKFNPTIYQPPFITIYKFVELKGF